MKVLVVDDDLVLSDVIGFALRRAGFEVINAYDGQSAYEQWQTAAPDLVVLDIKLPKLDGLTLFKRMRAHRDTPVIILSVQAADEDVVTGLEIGADDYIAKPFSPAQLVARVRAVLRRASKPAISGKLSARGLSLDVARRELQRPAQPDPVQLTQLECRLLEVLMLNGNQVMPVDALITHVWGVDGGNRVMLKQLMHRLRQKIEPDPANPVYLENVPGVGYALTRQGKYQ